MKKIVLILFLIISLVSGSSANAENTLRQPQGRMGVLSYKPEKYNSQTPANITAEDIKNIHKKIANNNENKISQKQIKEQDKTKKTQDKVKVKKEKTNLAEQKETGEKTDKKLSFRHNKKDNVQEKTEIKSQNATVETGENTEDYSDIKLAKDPETQNIVKEITSELSSSRAKMLEELSTLWVSAVQKSDTVYFAIMKLSNPNGEEVNKNGFKKIMEPIISAAPLVGQAFVNPALTAGSIIGSNVMGTMMSDGGKSRLAKVNDADLVILARAIDELQEELLLNYMAYKGAKEEYEFAIKIAEARQKEYEEMNKRNSPNTILANTFYTEALDNQYKARQEFLMKRVVLEQMVGSEALNEIENPKKEESLPNEDNAEKQ